MDSLQTWLKSEVVYGEELMRSAIAGARSARNEPVHVILGRSARTSLPLVTMGASIGLLASYCGNKGKSARTAAAWGLLLGAAIGFGTTVALNTRQLAEGTVRGAMKNISSVRDAHWLAKNPIDYA